MAVRLQFAPRREPPDLLDLPWGTPLAEWGHPRMVRMAKGRSRQVVRFVSDGERAYALKETAPPDAEREYAMLRRLSTENLTVVEAVGLVSGREDAAVVLLVRIHVEGFYRGDCSLANVLFRRDAGCQ